MAARPTPALIERLIARTRARAGAALVRTLETVEHTSGATRVVAGERLIDFAANDYLGLARHPHVIAALIRGAANDGVGARAAHLLGGHRSAHAGLEAALADWLGQERALLVGSGWLAHLSLFGALLESGDASVQDKRNHASMIDAARYAGAELVRYPHRDVAGCARQLERLGPRAALVATDGVFSMDGDIAPIAALATLAAAHRATFAVDEAHALGVLGPDGRGSAALAGLRPRDAIIVGTLGKAFGTYGAFVAGDAALIDGLIQFARPYVYATAPPPALATATHAALALILNEGWRRERLARLVARFRRLAHSAALPIMASTTPIQPLIVGSAARALLASAALRARGFAVPAIRPPTVPVGAARLRISLSAAHADGDIDRLVEALAAVLSALPDPAAGPHRAEPGATPESKATQTVPETECASR